MTSTTSVQINRLRTLLGWCEDNAHTLPDGLGVQIYPVGTVCLSWHDRQGGADEIAARLTEAFGPADDVRAYAGQTHAQWEATDGRPELVVYHVTVPESPPADTESDEDDPLCMADSGNGCICIFPAGHDGGHRCIYPGHRWPA